MPTLAATATSTAGLTGLLCLALVIATVCYSIGCWFWPFGDCRRCKGTGKRRSPIGRAFGLCRRCDGEGRRLRVGRRVINDLRDLHDKGTR
ncbi:hypothetical protein [Paractinoplanes atraurantiacus]|uniref:Uncharacterized protein n=1 Tax=Paractinoplanes atraurantiacus TaxID=1036182 RepID=A0A285JD74_9ACTN|nr:hypothetical protein [Actinoplanes atraurantiacus]SNY58212.1 hypothetical protein SAMN05421748_11934 [Actinoplanes atraurantiacus]